VNATAALTAEPSTETFGLTHNQTHLIDLPATVLYDPSQP